MPKKYMIKLPIPGVPARSIFAYNTDRERFEWHDGYGYTNFYTQEMIDGNPDFFELVEEPEYRLSDLKAAFNAARIWNVSAMPFSSETPETAFRYTTFEDYLRTPKKAN